MNGVHPSQIANENASYTYSLGPFGLQTDTYVKQVDLIHGVEQGGPALGFRGARRSLNRAASQEPCRTGS